MGLLGLHVPAGLVVGLPKFFGLVLVVALLVLCSCMVPFPFLQSAWGAASMGVLKAGHCLLEWGSSYKLDGVGPVDNRPSTD